MLHNSMNHKSRLESVGMGSSLSLQAVNVFLHKGSLNKIRPHIIFEFDLRKRQSIFEICLVGNLIVVDARVVGTNIIDKETAGIMRKKARVRYLQKQCNNSNCKDFWQCLKPMLSHKNNESGVNISLVEDGTVLNDKRMKLCVCSTGIPLQRPKAHVLVQ